MRRLLFACALTILPSTALAGDCSTLPKPKMTLRLTVDGMPPAAAGAIKAVVETVWAREGLTFSWAAGNEANPWKGIDAWIAVVGSAGKVTYDRTLGNVQFRDGAPSRLIRVYADAVAAWLNDDAHRYLGPSRSRDANLSNHPVLLGRVLGQVAAHEVGHFVLGLQTHALAGVMQVRFKRPQDALTGAGLRLDESSRSVLRSRLAARAACN